MNNNQRHLPAMTLETKHSHLDETISGASCSPPSRAESVSQPKTLGNPACPLQKRLKKAFVRPLLHIGLTIFGGLCTACAPWGEPDTNAPTAEQASADALEQAFQNPPMEARPRVWWHWMNGNITEEGVSRDLEWMARIGIGGVQNFDAALSTPQVVTDRLSYMSPKWQTVFKSAVTKANALDLEFGIASSPGWSITGGPWVPPEDAMKKLVWSETTLNANSTFEGKLPLPPAVTGPYQEIPKAKKRDSVGEAVPERFYRDIKVFAYPMSPQYELSQEPEIAINGSVINPNDIVDGDLTTGIPLPAKTDSGPGAMEFDYGSPQTVRSIRVFIKNPPSAMTSGPLIPVLEASTDGENWRKVTDISLSHVPSTVSFTPTTAKHFKLTFRHGTPANPPQFDIAPGVDFGAMAALSAGAPPKPPRLVEARLFGAPKVTNFEQKAGFAIADEYYELRTEDSEHNFSGVAPEQVIDLTDRMSEDGTLNWSPPHGSWKIIRLGYSLTGTTNHPATLEATGLEVDKYDSTAVEKYLNTYLDKYRAILGDDLIGEHGLGALLTDSIEAGPANWTPGMIEHFKRLRGYDPTPWIPALTGHIVGSQKESDAFLYDYRRTLADLVVTEHYETVARVAHERGLMVYGESLEGTREFSSLGDDLEMRRFADIPMAALWAYSEKAGPASRYIADMRGAASVAHIYGKRVVAAESLTSILAPWAHSPESLQPMIDTVFLNGINRPVIHTSVHQPLDSKFPGLSLSVFGQFFNRHETWAEMAKPWIDYISRNSYLLQQGHNVADVAYFYGEETPVGVMASDTYMTDVPEHYAYDFIPPHALLNEVSVKEGDLVTNGGARYKVLFLSGTSEYMTLRTLQRVFDLANSGATIAGLPPKQSPNLTDDSEEFIELVDQMWNGDTVSQIGRGQVIQTNNVEDALKRMAVKPAFSTEESVSSVGFVQRRIDNGDIYYVSNQSDAKKFDAHFRVSGKVPEIWHADTGAVEQTSYRQEDGITIVPLDMRERQSFFVVFREPTTKKSLTVSPVELSAVADIKGPWKVAFQEGRGAPSGSTFNDLKSLSDHENPGIKYFSGTATYTNSFQVPREVKPGSSVLLDLGNVGDVAEVFVNGEYAGTVWKKPYQLKVDQYLEEGENALEVRVANLWVNRLIGDQQPDANPITYTSIKTYSPSAPLRSSGLIGPVRLLSPNTPTNGKQ